MSAESISPWQAVSLVADEMMMTNMGDWLPHSFYEPEAQARDLHHAHHIILRALQRMVDARADGNEIRECSMAARAVEHAMMAAQKKADERAAAKAAADKQKASATNNPAEADTQTTNSAGRAEVPLAWTTDVPKKHKNPNAGRRKARRVRRTKR